MRIGANITLVVVLATVALAPGRAAADDAEAGRALFDEGARLLAAGRADEACPKLEASLRAFPGLGTRGKLAECYEKLGRFSSAYRLYRDVAEIARASGDETRERVAAARAEALAPKVSYVTVTVAASRDVAGLVVRRNGRELERGERDVPQPVDAGRVVVEITAPGHVPVREERSLPVGESLRFEVPRLEPLASAPQVEPPAAARSASPWRPIGLGIAGAGLVTAGVGAFFGLSAKSTYDGAFERGDCEAAGNTCNAAGQGAVDDARSEAALSTVLVAAGAVVAIGGAVLFFAAPSRAAALRVAPAAYAGGGGLAVSGALF